MADDPNVGRHEPRTGTISYWRLGRMFCATCGVVATVVRDVDALVCCPVCNQPAVVSCGDDAA